jgi:hypothetical protein
VRGNVVMRVETGTRTELRSKKLKTEDRRPKRTFENNKIIQSLVRVNIHVV